MKQKKNSHNSPKTRLISGQKVSKSEAAVDPYLRNANEIGTKSTNNHKSPGSYQEDDKQTNLGLLGIVN